MKLQLRNYISSRGGLCIRPPNPPLQMMGATIWVLPLLAVSLAIAAPSIAQAEEVEVSRKALDSPPRPPNTGGSNRYSANTLSVDPGHQYYQLGQYSQALLWLEAQLVRYRQQGDRSGEAAILSNLALVYSELGQWPQANQAIESSQLILGQRTDAESQKLLAQVLNTQGQLQFQQGNAEIALETWQRAERIFTSVSDAQGRVRSQLNQAYGLQSLGFYRRSLIVLTDLESEIQAEAPSLEKVTRLRSLGVAQRELGDEGRAAQTLRQSLAIARELEDGDAIAQSLIALGNLHSSQGKYQEALAKYEEAWGQEALPSTQLNAQLNGLRSLLELKQWRLAHNRWPQLLDTVSKSPSTSNTIQAQLNLAQSLQRLQAAQPSPALSSRVIAKILSSARQNAKQLGDRRLESYALGKLGAVYENEGQYHEAMQLTQRALQLVDVQSMGEIAYQWQWQMGRIAKQQGRIGEAIASYDSAVKVLGGLRQDLVSSTQDHQFDFRDRVEPLYREFVSLLLAGPDPSPQDLEKARQAMESLQLAELDNFFRSACLDVTPVIVDQVDQSATVIYPIILEDKLAVVVRLPGQPLKLYVSSVARSRVEWIVDRLQLSLAQPNSDSYLELSQQLYDVLLRPAIADIQASRTKTLVFIPDGVLRNIPLGVLHSGDRFVIEDYAVSVTPGLQLLQAGEGNRGRSQVLIAGLSEEQEQFPKLKHVKREVEAIRRQIQNRTFVNEGFTQRNLEKAIEGRSFPIMHLATHGRFSSDLNNTFLLAWGGEKIDIDRLRGVLRDSELRYQSSLELLVLSACETALGDSRAILGLAGIAARSGAKSTLASLWKVNDEATAVLMEKFYGELSDRGGSKAEALRMAQRSMLRDPIYGKHPFYWSSFILIGIW